MALHRVPDFTDLDHPHRCSTACRHPSWTHLPFEPLRVAARCETAGELAAQVGRSTRQVVRWKSTGVPVGVADRVACALGLHPVNVWPEWEAML